ncbi:MarR family transcriptional regulator [Cellulosimicrobium terreum]|nr:MarR family transcriptional regulator [Cellulosimicrobium terreum]
MTVASGNDSRAAREDDAALATLADVELEVAQLLRRAERTRASGEPHRADRRGLDRSGYLLLHALDTRGPQNVNALADHLGIDASTVTRQVVSLDKAGHVRRTRDPRDGRAVVVEATDTGIERLRRHREARAALYADVLRDWSRLDRALLAELLERLNDGLDDYRRRRDDD